MRNKERLWQAVVIVLSLLCLVISAFAAVRIKEVVGASSSSITALQTQIKTNMRAGYRALVDIDAGEMITDSMVEYSSNLPSDIDQSLFITGEDIGKVATISINAGTPILTEMVSAQLAADYHERECSFIWLNTNLEDNDFVDVRILFPNGEDYIVAAKKSIKEVNVAANNVFLWLTEDEIQLLDAAIVDANLHNAKIYVTKYIKPEVQEASTVTYAPNTSVLTVIRDDPNIVDVSAANLSAEARAGIENRLELFEKAYPDLELNLDAGSNSGYTNSDSDSGVSATEDAGVPTTTEDATEESEVEYVD